MKFKIQAHSMNPNELALEKRRIFHEQYFRTLGQQTVIRAPFYKKRLFPSAFVAGEIVLLRRRMS